VKAKRRYTVQELLEGVRYGPEHTERYLSGRERPPAAEPPARALTADRRAGSSRAEPAAAVRPRIFISYSHDSDDHRERVLGLAQQLRRDGVDAWLDQFVEGSPEEGWPLWMERQVEQARFVLMICTATYHRRYLGEEESGQGLGATWEAVLTRGDLYEGQGRNRKLVPVLFADGEPEHIPKPLRQHTKYRLPDYYAELLRFLKGQPAIVPEPLGPM